jgi:molybdate transport system substrate-binding protein
VKFTSKLGFVVLLLVVGAACGGARSAINLTVYAASSLSEAVTAVTAQYTAEHPVTRFTISTGSSTALRTQIEQGARADLLLSADTRNPQALVDGGLADGAETNFAANRLAIVVGKGNPAGLMSPFDLARAGVRVVAAGDAVPITAYATTLVNKLAVQTGAPADFAANYAANVISQEEDVKSVLTKVELGDADAAIVYATDAQAASDKVDVVPIPDPAQVGAVYSGVVTKASSSVAAAHAFLTWLAGPEGQGTLARYGFTSP